jgi:hypothetical protein
MPKKKQNVLERRAVREQESIVRNLSKDEIEKKLSHQDEAFAWFKQKLDELPLTKWADADHPLQNWEDKLLIKEKGEHKMHSVRNNFYNPKGKQDSSQPWFSKGYTPSNAKAFLRKLRCLVPAKLQAYDENVANNISRPTNTGIIGRKKGQYFLNKGGDNLVKAHSSRPHTVREERHSYALNKVCELIIELNGGSKITIEPWTVNMWASEMKKAIKSSSPGYPFNGYDWESIIDGRPVYEHVFDAGRSLIERGFQDAGDGFLYSVGVRSTGDRGDMYDPDCLEGAARLMLESSSLEKEPGHELAYPYKYNLLRHSPLSGQNGIQAVSDAVHKLNSGELKGEWSDSKPKAYYAKDVGGWDGSQTLPNIMPELRFIYENTLDLEDKYTKQLYETYMSCIEESYTLTPMGLLKVIILPSGCSNTTVWAFMKQYIMKFEADWEFEKRIGRSPFVSTGYQGDDLILALDSWEPFYEEIIESVYGDHNCTFKEGDDGVAIVGDGQYVTFLSEKIYLDGDEPNFRPLKWQFFWMEKPGEGNNGIKPDRMLLEEVEKHVAHPSSRELHMASLLSKLDSLLPAKYRNNPLEGADCWSVRRWAAVAEELWKHNQSSYFPLRSWIGARVMPTSPTRKLWQTLEERKGIETPSRGQQAVDREESSWILGQHLGTMFAVCSYLNKEVPSARPCLREMVKEGRRNRKAFKLAKNALHEVGSSAEISSEDIQEMEVLREILIKAMDDYFIRVGQELKEISTSKRVTDREEADMYAQDPDVVNNEGEPMFNSTIARDMLAYNIANPHQLHDHFIKVLFRVRESSDWGLLSQETKDWIREVYKEIYYGNLDDDIVSANPELDNLFAQKAEEIGLEEAISWYDSQLQYLEANK